MKMKSSGVREEFPLLSLPEPEPEGAAGAGQKASDGNPSILTCRLAGELVMLGPGARPYFTQWLVIASLEGQWPTLN